MDMATELNARAGILITRELPGTATLKVPATIWWLGGRFHVRDESGLPVDDLLALASSPRGFGREPRTKEEFMDTRTRLSGVTEVYGDRAARHGTVIEDGRKLEVETESLLPLGQLVLSGDVTGLKPTGRGKLLGRDAIEYTTPLSGKDGARSTVRRRVSGPYTLLREVTDERRAGALLRVEVLSLDEGVVTEMDVRG
nr:hypothetical protein [Micromonospora sp. DSM 115978]